MRVGGSAFAKCSTEPQPLYNRHNATRVTVQRNSDLTTVVTVVQPDKYSAGAAIGVVGGLNFAVVE